MVQRPLPTQSIGMPRSQLRPGPLPRTKRRLPKPMSIWAVMNVAGVSPDFFLAGAVSDFAAAFTAFTAAFATGLATALAAATVFLVVFFMVGFCFKLKGGGLSFALRSPA